MARCRLRYLARVARQKPRALLSLLGSNPKKCKLPWTKLITEDLIILRCKVSLCSHLPDPDEDPQSWISFILEDASK
eukprot:417013-Karenia_brevis.AAC.1